MREPQACSRSRPRLGKYISIYSEKERERGVIERVREREKNRELERKMETKEEM